MTGLATLYDYTKKSPYQDDLVGEFLNFPEIKKAFGVKETINYEICKWREKQKVRESVDRKHGFSIDCESSWFVDVSNED